MKDGRLLVTFRIAKQQDFYLIVDRHKTNQQKVMGNHCSLQAFTSFNFMLC